MCSQNTTSGIKYLVLGLVLTLSSGFDLQAQSVDQQQNQELELQNQWPDIEAEQKPWTRWWWMGNAVDKPTLTWHLEQLHEKGIGGVEITPIYGVEGYEDEFIDYLSPEWMEMLEHTVAEANRLGMKVDMILGTGWPYGGPWINKKDGARRVAIQTYQLAGGENLPNRVEHVNRNFAREAPLHALMAYSTEGESRNLIDRMDERGNLNWTAPAGEEWTLIAFFGGWTAQQVKRAAPGGAGNVMDHFSDAATQSHLNRFDEAFSGFEQGAIRAFFNDSYEVYGADWTYDFFEQFEKYQNYDLRQYLPAFLGMGEHNISRLNYNLTAGEMSKRVRSDYYETIHLLAMDRFAEPWVEWTHSQGSIAKNQAHGFPGNILDFYGVADIPEMEIFGQREFNIPDLRQNQDLTNLERAPNPLLLKFASSAAHVEGKPRTSSESATWLDEHFRVSLSQVKPHLDMQMVAGINHMIYHGMTYSPREENWPGWLFYASTNFAPKNTIWRNFGALNSYMANSQSFLQQSTPANDLLLYFPIYDLWHQSPDASQQRGNSWSVSNNLFTLAVGNPDEWFYGTPVENLADYLWEQGYTFDYVSDRQLKALSFQDNQIVTGNTAYKTVVVPQTDHMPLETFRKLIDLAEDGATVVFRNNLPDSVPGLDNIAARQSDFEQLVEALDFQSMGKQGLFEARIGEGRIIKGENVEYLLSEIGVQREPVADRGIEFIRRSHSDGHYYFLTNLHGQPVDGWVPLGTNARSAIIFDPVNHRQGMAKVQQGQGGGSEVRLQLKPGESIIIKTFSTKNITGEDWIYTQPAGQPRELEGTWSVRFEEGGPEIPENFETEKLASWTRLGGAEARRFEGTATYSLSFERPESAADYWLLDLGRVAESAEVKLNGQNIGTRWSHPFEIRINDDVLREGPNQLEISVTNLGANRIADMDRKEIQWAKFYDINFVNLDYEPFDASGWEPMESGLLGPVELTPFEKSD